MSAPHLAPGHVVAGKYTIRSLLAFSSAAATYHATDAQGGQVALKLLDPAIGQRADVMGALDRVTAETAALAGASVHPVLESGYDQGTSAPYRVTEYLAIPSLARLVENGPLSEQVVLALLQGLAAALDAAHARGLYHHALKPTNLFVGPAPHYPVLVSDFGARFIRDAVPTQETYALSAPWWAPEQLQPGAQLGVQTDVFAVALLAFYALTGRSFWRACQSNPPDIQALQQELYSAPPLVSARAQELGRPLSAAWDGPFARALAADPAHRPRSTGDFIQMLVPTSSQAVAPYAAPVQSAPAAPPQPSYPAAQASVPAVGYGPAPSAPAAEVSAPAVVAPASAPAAALSAAEAAPPHPATPGLPAFPEPAQKRKGSSMAPVIIGVIGAVLLGGAAVAYLFFFRGPSTDTDSVASATSVATGETATGESGATSDGEGGGGPEAADAGVDAGQTVAVTFVCVPGCDEISVDGEPIDKLDEAVPLLPGKHTVLASKKGYIPRKETITVELGGPVEKKLVLVKLGAGPAPKKKDCGKFLKRCD